MTGLEVVEQTELSQTPNQQVPARAWNDINPDGIPESLKKVPRWINWKLEGKNKTPKRPDGFNASSTKESDWSDYATVLEAASKHGYGLGFVFNNDEIFGADIDDCIDPLTGIPKPWARYIIQTLDTYAEISPSGTGVKLFLRGSLSEPFRKKLNRPDGNGAVEFYATGRYFTVTGQHLEGTPKEVQDRQAELTRVYADVCDWKQPTKQQPATASTYVPSYQPSGSSDRDTAILALTAISPDVGYEDWLTVLQACHDTDPSLLPEVISWSRGSDKFVPGEVERKWASFTGGKGIGIGSLCKLADDSGRTWRPITNRLRTEETPEERLRGEIEVVYLELGAGRKVEEVAQKLINALPGTSKDATGGIIAPPFSLKMMNSRAFANAEYKIEFICDQILVADQNCMLGGPPKTLKTSIALDLVISTGTGTPFLGKFPVKKAVPTGIISGESGLYTLQRNARVIAQQRGINLEDAQCFWGETLPQISKPAHLVALRQMIEQYSLKACFIDPAYLCLLAGDTKGRSASSMFDMGPLLLDLGKVGQDAGCSMILIHHNKKNSTDPFAVPELGDMAFSGFAEWARQWILLGRRERYEEGTGLHRLWLKAGGSVGHNDLFAVDVDEGVLDAQFNGRRWDISIGSPADARRDKARKKTQEKEDEKNTLLFIHTDALKKAYDQCPQGETIKRLRELSKLNDSNFKTVNALLLEEGIIEACDILKNGVKYKGFKNRPYRPWIDGSDGSKGGSIPSCPTTAA